MWKLFLVFTKTKHLSVKVFFSEIYVYPIDNILYNCQLQDKNK